MFCANCGTKNEDGAMFCANCGQKLEVPVAPVAAAPVAPVVEPAVAAPVTPVAPAVEPVVAAPVAPAVEPAVATPVTPVAPVVEPVPVAPAANPTPASEEKKGDKKIKPLYFIIAGAALAFIIIIVAVCAALAGSGKGFDKQVADISVWYDYDADESYVTYNSKAFSNSVEGTDLYLAKSSGDASVAALFDGDDLYVVTKKAFEKIAEDVDYVNISFDGSTIAYVSDESLFMYSVNSRKSVKVAEDVVRTPVLSPSGKSVLYQVDNGDDRVMTVYNGKKSVSLNKNVTPLALTDNCKIIYYYDPSKDALYTTNLKDDSNKIASDVYDHYFFNKTCTQVMFTCDKGLQVSVNGGEAIRLSSSAYSAYPICANADLAFVYEGSAVVIGVSSLNQMYYKQDTSIVFYDKKWESNKVVNNVYEIEVSDDAKSIYYTNDESNLYHVKLDGKYESTKIKSDVDAFYITSDGSACYFLVDDSLYYQKGKKDAKKISDDVDYLYMTHDDIALFLMDCGSYTGSLYSSKNGGNKAKIDDDCYDVMTGVATTFIYTDYDSSDRVYDLCVASKGSNFKLLLEAVR